MGQDCEKNVLFAKVLRRIYKEQRFLIFKQRLILISLSLISFLIVFIPTFQIMQRGFFESGFTNFFLLIFSDFGSALTNWKNFTFVLLESFPVMNITIFLVAIFIFLASLRLLSKKTWISINFYNQKL